ncbi:MAG: AAA family ATPase [Candidatus Hydrogenedentes bacterium]|nr:AAA family ATPase [Candidatus Hydrogenedentota bacterium]
MYEAFYGLREKPFNLTPDPKFLYLSEKHREAFAHLLFGIKNRNGFIMISGEIGTGKTTICRNLLNQLDRDTEIAIIFNPFLSPEELLRKINTEFGIDSKADNLLGLTEELNLHLLSASARGKNCVLVIDEAQNLDTKVLEQIRLLSNLETDSSKLLQIVLIGQPELAEKLAAHELRQLNQRITARYHLKPLDQKETLQYIAYRLHVAGGKRASVHFDRKAVREIYRLSGGTPRVINALCDRALLIGYTKETHVITAPIIRQAAREIQGEKVAARKASEKGRWKNWLPQPSLVVGALVALAAVHFLLRPLDRLANELNAVNQWAARGVPAGTDNPQAQPNAVAASVPDRSGATSLLERLGSMAPRVERAGAGLPDQVDPAAWTSVGCKQVAARWGVTDAESPPLNADPETLVHWFQDRGLACEWFRPGVAQLLALNLPCLARVEWHGKTMWVGLVWADEQGETVGLARPDGDGLLKIDRLAFRNAYANEALVPWRDPEPGAGPLLPGQQGPAVARLKEMLRRLGRLSPTNAHGTYDAETASAVAGIQAETGMKVDGKAGRQVRCVLTAWSGGDGVPALGIRGTTREQAARVVTPPPSPAPATPPAPPAPMKQEAPLPSPKKTDSSAAVNGNDIAIPKEGTGEAESQPLPPAKPSEEPTNPIPDSGPENAARPDRPAMETRELPPAPVFTPAPPAAVSPSAEDSGVTPPAWSTLPLLPKDQNPA